MLVVTNELAVDGATEILFPNVRDAVCEYLHSDECLVLPSSRHETLCVAMECCVAPDRLTELVRQINETAVSPNDRLSDNVYRFRKGGELEMVCAPAC